VIECSNFEDYGEYETSDDEEQEFVKIDSEKSNATLEPRDIVTRTAGRGAYEISDSQEKAKNSKN
jgi:hypothetical protein